ncbi:hypothetical protein BGX38DRAFT_1141485 [Terfezia claveryi]|nr:hypothetical protein BGX38DRAFT_1141485 [Terfezia claveryi]
MCPSSQDDAPGALEMLSAKYLPSAEAAPWASPITTPPPPVYGSHNLDNPFPAPTTSITEQYEQQTESRKSIKPPRQKKRPDYYLITLFVLCTLFIVIGMIDWIITTERGKAELERLYSKAADTSSDMLKLIITAG